MKIREIKAKSIITKSSLPDTDFVINPYVGCTHGCIYCYATFMKRFTNHNEQWGKFLDIKINSPALIKKTNKYKNKSILASSVTDPYQPIERRCKLMRGILENLIHLQPELCILTKSDLITRDIDLLKKFKKIKAGFSLSVLNEEIRKQIEPIASPNENRISALKKLKKAGIPTFIFISPILPELTDYKKIINRSKKFADEFWFENLNIRPTNWFYIQKWLKNKHPNLLKKYIEIYFKKNNYWKNFKKEIENFCNKNKIEYNIYFHHKKSLI
jgi:DNA repair photolyase